MPQILYLLCLLLPYTLFAQKDTSGQAKNNLEDNVLQQMTALRWVKSSICFVWRLRRLLYS